VVLRVKHANIELLRMYAAHRCRPPRDLGGDSKLVLTNVVLRLISSSLQSALEPFDAPEPLDKRHFFDVLASGDRNF